MLRTKEQLESEIRLRSHLDRLASEALEYDEDGWIASSKDSNARRLAEVVESSREVGDGFEWAFDGAGVYGSQITVQRLAEIADPLAQTMRWVANDLTFETTSVEQRDPVITGMFEGSFGLRIVRAPVPEQTTLDGSTSFDRSAERVLAIFRAAQTGDTDEVMESLTGLRTFALSGISKLSKTLAESDRPTWMRWRGSTVVTVTSESASAVSGLVDTVETTEDDIPVVGRLQGGDVEAGRFHLVEDGSPALHYHGRVAEDVRLVGIEFGSRVRAAIHVVTTTSPLIDRPRESFTLKSVEQIGPALDVT